MSIWNSSPLDFGKSILNCLGKTTLDDRWLFFQKLLQFFALPTIVFLKMVLDGRALLIVLDGNSHHLL
jgi:hypothetical protein